MFKYVFLGIAILLGINHYASTSFDPSNTGSSLGASVLSLSVKFEERLSDASPYLAGSRGDYHQAWVIGDEPVGWSMDIATGWKEGEGEGKDWKVGCPDPRRLRTKTVEFESISTSSDFSPLTTFANLPLPCLTSFQTSQDSFLVRDLDKWDREDPLLHLKPFFERVGSQLRYLRLEETGDDNGLSNSLFSIQPWILPLVPNLLTLDIIGPHDVSRLALFGHSSVREIFIGEKVDWKMKADEDEGGDEFFWLEERDEWQVVRFLIAAGREVDWKLRWPKMETIYLRGASFGETERKEDGERLEELCWAARTRLGWEVKDRDGIRWEERWEAVGMAGRTKKERMRVLTRGLE
ncbi:hypothetical protein BDY24DRAFT_17432 [Mrakia frigida]|uniref:uncharacterized protein n=1 Tax=Mrakia frigida TaxID=29902 RepID=UPI003FCC1120